jgi:hypothetical protein
MCLVLRNYFPAGWEESEGRGECTTEAMVSHYRLALQGVLIVQTSLHT